MVRIGRSVVVAKVTAYAGVRRIVVVAVVAGRTVVGNDSVLPVELIIIIVNIEGRGLPSGLGRVAAFAICR